MLGGVAIQCAKLHMANQKLRANLGCRGKTSICLIWHSGLV